MGELSAATSITPSASVTINDTAGSAPELSTNTVESEATNFTSVNVNDAAESAPELSTNTVESGATNSTSMTVSDVAGSAPELSTNTVESGATNSTSMTVSDVAGSAPELSTNTVQSGATNSTSMTANDVAGSAPELSTNTVQSGAVQLSDENSTETVTKPAKAKSKKHKKHKHKKHKHKAVDADCASRSAADGTDDAVSAAEEPSATGSSRPTTAKPLSSRRAALPDPYRIWVGNIAPKVTEYQLLRLVRPIGTLTKFDFILHRSGPLAGRPRGYAFVSYSTHEEAARARVLLEGTPIGGNRLHVRWANEQLVDGVAPVERREDTSDVPVIGPEMQIRAIESKLRVMEQGSADPLDTSRTQLWQMPRIRGPLHWINKWGSANRPPQHKPYHRDRKK